MKSKPKRNIAFHVGKKLLKEGQQRDGLERGCEETATARRLLCGILQSQRTLSPPGRTMRRRGLHRLRRRGQNMVEVVILVGLVALGVAWLTDRLPKAIKAYHQSNQQVIASPL